MKFVMQILAEIIVDNHQARQEICQLPVAL